MSLDKFFNPESIAVVGASCHKGKVGYKGKIFPVNPGCDTIEGLTCYATIESVGQTPDLVIIVIPAKKVPAVMKQCAKVKVKAVIIVTAGFKEVGPEGKELAKQFTQIAKSRGVNRFYAKVMPVNKPMLSLFYNSGYKVNTEFDGDVYNIVYDLIEKEGPRLAKGSQDEDSEGQE